MRQQLEFMLQVLRECLIAGPRYTWDLKKNVGRFLKATYIRSASTVSPRR